MGCSCRRYRRSKTPASARRPCGAWQPERANPTSLVPTRLILPPSAGWLRRHAHCEHKLPECPEIVRQQY